MSCYMTLCNGDRGMCPQKSLNYIFSVDVVFYYNFCMHKQLKVVFLMIKSKQNKCRKVWKSLLQRFKDFGDETRLKSSEKFCYCN